MPEAFRQIKKFCKICGKCLKLNNNRDITRKKFCSRKCLGKSWSQYGNPFLNKKHKYKSKKIMSKKKKDLIKNGWKTVDWKKYDIPVHYNAYHGYILKGSKRLHRILAEQKIGRKLYPNEIVHHIDGDKLNNSIDNLQIMTNSEHTKLHLLKRKEVIFCAGVI
jgi:hypothetical protein